MANIKPVTHAQLTHWVEQITTERCAWADTREPDQKVRDAYRAGLQQGISELVLTLELHGHLVTR